MYKQMYVGWQAAFLTERKMLSNEQPIEYFQKNNSNQESVEYFHMTKPLRNIHWLIGVVSSVSHTAVLKQLEENLTCDSHALGIYN